MINKLTVNHCKSTVTLHLQCSNQHVLQIVPFGNSNIQVYASYQTLLLKKRIDQYYFQAVLQFYQQSMVHPQIHEWLTKAQISPEAWSFSWELLGSQKVCVIFQLISVLKHQYRCSKTSYQACSDFSVNVCRNLQNRYHYFIVIVMKCI